MVKKTKKTTEEKEQENLDLKKVLDAVLDGVITKKQKDVFYLMPKAGNKEMKFFLTAESVFSRVKLSLPNKVVSEGKIKWESIKEGDNLSLTIDKVGKKQVALMVKQIVVED